VERRLAGETEVLGENLPQSHFVQGSPITFCSRCEQKRVLCLSPCDVSVTVTKAGAYGGLWSSSPASHSKEICAVVHALALSRQTYMFTYSVPFLFHCECKECPYTIFIFLRCELRAEIMYAYESWAYRKVSSSSKVDRIVFTNETP
jgi:hypothetical protein